MHALRRPRESSDDGHLLIAAELSLDSGRAVIYSAAFKPGKIGERQFSILRPGRNDDTATLHGPAIIQFDGIWRPIAPQRASGSSDRNMRPEFLRLNEGTAGEILAGNSRGETEVVFDAGTPSVSTCRRDTGSAMPLARPVVGTLWSATARLAETRHSGRPASFMPSNACGLVTS